MFTDTGIARVSASSPTRAGTSSCTATSARAACPRSGGGWGKGGGGNPLSVKGNPYSKWKSLIRKGNTLILKGNPFFVREILYSEGEQGVKQGD